MGLTARKTSAANLERLRNFLSRHAETLEPGLTVVDSRLKLGGTDVDVLATDRHQTPVLVVAGGVADGRLLVAGLEACLWCLAFPDTLRRQYPDTPMALYRPPRLIFVAEHVPEEFVRMVEALSVVRAECHELSCAWPVSDGGRPVEGALGRAAPPAPAGSAELPVEPVQQAVLGLREALAELLGDPSLRVEAAGPGQDAATAAAASAAAGAPAATEGDAAAPWRAEHRVPDEAVAAAAETWNLEPSSLAERAPTHGRPAPELATDAEPVSLGQDRAAWEARASEPPRDEVVSPGSDEPAANACEPSAVQRPTWAAPAVGGRTAPGAGADSPGTTVAGGERARVFFRRREGPAGTASGAPSSSGQPPERASVTGAPPAATTGTGGVDEDAAVNHPALEALRFPKGGVSRQWQEFLDQLTRNR